MEKKFFNLTANGMSAFLICLGVLITVLITEMGNRPALKLRDRTLIMRPELSKEKTFDKKRHAFEILLTVSVRESDLFKFNEDIPELRRGLFKFIEKKKAKIETNDARDIESLFKKQLNGESIYSSNLIVLIHKKY